jgi:hypothetical protein
MNVTRSLTPEEMHRKREMKKKIVYVSIFSLIVLISAGIPYILQFL